MLLQLVFGGPSGMRGRSYTGAASSRPGVRGTRSPRPAAVAAVHFPAACEGLTVRARSRRTCPPPGGVGGPSLGPNPEAHEHREPAAAPPRRRRHARLRRSGGRSRRRVERGPPVLVDRLEELHPDPYFGRVARRVRGGGRAALRPAAGAVRRGDRGRDVAAPGADEPRGAATATRASSSGGRAPCPSSSTASRTAGSSSRPGPGPSPWSDRASPRSRAPPSTRSRGSRKRR